MSPYRDPPRIVQCKMLSRVGFPLEDILDISLEEYCSRSGIGMDYYVRFKMVYSCDYRKSIDVPKGTEAVIGHKVVQDKFGIYCTCIALVPKSIFSF